MKRLVDHFAFFNQMSAIQRFSRDRMAKPESVLEHTGFVVLFCIWAAKAIERNNDIMFDMGMLLEKAALHDIDEPVLGDIPRPTKYMSLTTAKEFKYAEERAVERVGQFFDIELLHIWMNAKDETREGRLVYMADLAAVVYALWTEVYLYGNKSFVRVGRELSELMKQLASDQSLSEAWEIKILAELQQIVTAISYEQRGHPELNPIIRLDKMLKEEDRAKENTTDASDEEIPF